MCGCQQCAGTKAFRAECLVRYREKKQRRKHTKTIRYAMRKVNADKRPRVKGRFVKVADEAEAARAAQQQVGDVISELCGFMFLLWLDCLEGL